MEVTDLNITFKRPRFAKVLKHVLSEEECEAWIQRAEEADAWEEALINVGAGAVNGSSLSFPFSLKQCSNVRSYSIKLSSNTATMH